ncbi:polysaccharide biosynthesis protein [Neokomagataea tanensis]|nr:MULTISPECIES: nucleoside-diphosphate sugar epimerase/dehydratase [Neokomagataea]
MTRSRRIALNIALDGGVSAIAAPLARWLAAPEGGLLHPLWFIAGGGITLLVCGLPFRMPQQYWRFSGLSDLIGIACASVVSACLFMALLLVCGFGLPTPTFPLIHALVLLVLLGAIRMFWRICTRFQPWGLPRERVLLIGADFEADLFMRAMERDRTNSGKIIGVVTLSEQQAGRRIHRAPILGALEEFPELLRRLVVSGRQPGKIIVTSPTLRGGALSRVLDAARVFGVDVLRTPSLTALQPASRLELQPIAIEDLLNRAPVALDNRGIQRLLAGRVVAVTGAGGSIGSELVRQIASYGPKILLLIEQSEYALWQVHLDLSERYPDVACVQVIADVRDRLRMMEVFQQNPPEIVFHAAALKHVPLVENNPIEGVRTNVLGTRVVLDTAQATGARATVLVSTDKAVNPSSLMGASKRCAEIYGQALDMMARNDAGSMRCVTVRFGNVLGSTGSVVPLFRRQLEQGGPLTVTHPKMTRYFMTIPEAVGLVLQAAARGTRDHEGETATEQRLREGGIFVLDMGEPVQIMDLACQMIRLARLRPHEDIEIRITGLRPGEKLFEELFHGREAPVPTDAAGLRIATPRTVNFELVSQALDALDTACHQGNLMEVMGILQHLVPEFRHNTGALVPETVADEMSSHD